MFSLFKRLPQARLNYSFGLQAGESNSWETLDLPR